MGRRADKISRPKTRLTKRVPTKSRPASPRRWQLMLQSRYAQPIVQGRKRWEGRALKGRAAKVCVGDTVVLNITGHGKVGVLRALSFRVAEVRTSTSCATMIGKVGLASLLPDFSGTVREACALYHRLVGAGRYVAWRIDRPSVRMTEKKQRVLKDKPPVHWTKGRGMVTRGAPQAPLDTARESLLTRFGLAMMKGGHTVEQVERHKDRLRFCQHALKNNRKLSAVPPKCESDTLALIKRWPVDRRLHGHVSCSFNWFVKFTQRQPLIPRMVNQRA